MPRIVEVVYSVNLILHFQNLEFSILAVVISNLSHNSTEISLLLVNLRMKTIFLYLQSNSP